MPFITIGARLNSGKLDRLKFHDLNYDTTTTQKLKELVLGEYEKKACGNDTESKEKKFKSDEQTDEKPNLCVQDIDLLYCGRILKDDSNLSFYSVKDYVMLHLYPKNKLFGRKIEQPLVSGGENVPSVPDENTLLAYFKELKAGGRLFLYKFRSSEHVKKIVQDYPALRNDPVALSFLRNPELLVASDDLASVKNIVSNHPSLAQCIKSLVDMWNERASSGATPSRQSSSQTSTSSPYLSADEDMDASPSTTSEMRITPEQVAAALRSASSSVSQSPALTPEYSAMMQIMANLSTPTGGGGASSTPSSGASASGSSTENGTLPSLASQIELYSSQLQQMRELGLTDDVVALQALQLTNGDVTAAVNLVFSGSLTGDQ